MKAVCKPWVLSAYNPFQKGNTIVVFIVFYCSGWKISLKMNKLGFPFCLLFSFNHWIDPFSLYRAIQLSTIHEKIYKPKKDKQISSLQREYLQYKNKITFFFFFQEYKTGTCGNSSLCWLVMGLRCGIGVSSYFLYPHKCFLWHYICMRLVFLVSLRVIWGQMNQCVFIGNECSESNAGIFHGLLKQDASRGNKSMGMHFAEVFSSIPSEGKFFGMAQNVLGMGQATEL